jgi:ribosomal protein S6--L-glutamate ligase
MILSFHPCFESDTNILCAGRLPDESDLNAIQTADAVILPQGCKKELFEMATRHCRHVFPDYQARFQYPGKTGQIRLFEKLNVPHPRTITFHDIHQYHQKTRSNPVNQLFSFPLVFKFNWGGEGETVFLISNPADLEHQIKKAELFEKNNQKGFLIQEYIPTDQKVIRVVVIGTCYQSYWRIQGDPEKFTANLSTGARIDHEEDPDLQQKAITAVQAFCQKTSINLAGFDLLFSTKENPEVPLFLEINYFFGRKGLGGSERFYKLLDNQIKDWIGALPKSLK